MNMIITGDVGIGKSTVCRKIVDMAKGNGLTCGGVLTYKQDQNLWVESIGMGHVHLLASVSEDEGGIPIGRYFFSSEGIQLGQCAVRQSLHVDLFVVDEMGPLELRGKGFTDVFDVIQKRQSKANLLVIRRNLLQEFENRFNGRFRNFEMTLENRGRVHEDIYGFLQDFFRGAIFHN